MNQPNTSPAVVHTRREDIDGLRAFAVLAVLFNHLGAVPGGFIGVDVFFVISGFLITRIIYDDLDTGQFSIIDFYARRARRILPAFFLISVLTAIAATIFLLPEELINFGRSLSRSAFFVPNFYFESQAGYFEPAASQLPLLHFWSLGVEEQFYAAFPVIMLTCAIVLRRHYLLVIALLALTSFAAAVWSTSSNPTSAFYRPELRAWELLCGSLLAILGGSAPTQIAPLLSTGGLSLLGAGAVLYSDATPFPGLAALLPCAAAVLVIYGQSRVLGSPPLAWIGRISYSLYLVHWPIIVFFDRYLPQAPRVGRTVIVSVAAIALADLSYRFVETPFRKRMLLQKHWQILAGSTLALAGLFAVGFFISRMDGLPWRVSPEIRAISAYLDYPYKPIFRDGSCFLHPDQQPFDFDRQDCFAAGSGKSALMWGDSLAAHYFGAIAAALPGIRLGYAGASACAPILDVDVSDRPNCRAFNNMIMDIIRSDPPDLVILSAYWSRFNVVTAELVQTIQVLRDAGSKVIVLGPGPFYDTPVPVLLAQLKMAKSSSNSADAHLLRELRSVDAAMKSQLVSLPGVIYISVLETMCEPDGCPLATSTGVPVHWDSAHLTAEGAEFFLGRFGPTIRDAIE